MPLLLDISCLCDRHTDGALDHIYKAMSEPPDDDGRIWEDHPSPLIRRLVELFTVRGLTRLNGMRDELQKWLSGEMHQVGAARAPRPAGSMERWSTPELQLVKLYLETLPTAEFQLDDWMMVVDYLVQRYLPASDLRSEAEWLATRANLMGKVQAAMATAATEAEADRILQAMPSTAQQAEAEFGLTRRQRAVLDYGNARCVENVVALADDVRHRMRRLVMDRTEAEFLGDKARTGSSLQTQLLDEFGVLNRDWRRIAITEAGENLNQGLVASLPSGARVKRVEQYRGACAFCRSIDGRVMTVVDPAKPEKNGDTEIWVGKTNVGRSASPRKREGGRLVEREAGERWWVAAGVQHPHCRGTWIRLAEAQPGDDPKFAEWLSTHLARM